MCGKPLGRTSWMPGVIGTSAAGRGGVGLFPVSGRARSAGRHQFAVAAVRHLQPVAGGDRAVRRHHDPPQDARARYMWITLAPLVWLVTVTFSAAWAKMFDPNPLIGLLSHAHQIAAGPVTADLARRILNDRLDAAVCGLLMALVSMIVIESALVWISVISGRKQAVIMETPFVPTKYALEETL